MPAAGACGCKCRPHHYLMIMLLTVLTALLALSAARRPNVVLILSDEYVCVPDFFTNHSLFYF